VYNKPLWGKWQLKTYGSLVLGSVIGKGKSE
jgi:hypothetical protein